MNRSSKYNQQQTEPKQCKSEVEKLRNHQKPGNWPLQYLKTNNTRKSWGFHARENFSGETIYI